MQHIFKLTRTAWVLAFALCSAAIGAQPAAADKFVPRVPPTPTVAEGRKIVLAYINKMATIQWVCKETMDYSKEKTYTKTLIYQPGVTYHGQPYVSHQNGVEFFGKFLNENRVYQGPLLFKDCPGTTCASSVKVAWSNVSPTVSFGGTPNMLPHAGTGTVPVGDYQWQVNTPAEGTMTKDIVQASTTNAMFEAYALWQPADAMVSRYLTKAGATNGHARMVSSAPVVVRDAQGKINGKESYVTVIEQTGAFDKALPYQTTWRIDKKYTFADLAATSYVPLTLAEFKAGKLADATLEVTGLTSPTKLAARNSLAGEIASNFILNEVAATIYRADGAVAAQSKYFPDNKRCNLAAGTFDRDVTQLPAGNYRFLLIAKIGYGDCVAADCQFVK